MKMKPQVSKGNLQGERLTHPAFGAITVHRQTHGGGQGVWLNGSDFWHDRTISICIQPEAVERSLSNDWHLSEGAPHIEVIMSEAQWATFVSSIGIGSGTPCTVKYVSGKEMPDIEPLEARAETFKREMDETIKDGIEALRTAIAAAKEAKVKRSIIDGMETALREINQNMPFVEKQFSEHVEKTVEKAKTEAHAYMQHVKDDVFRKHLNQNNKPTLIEGKS